MDINSIDCSYDIGIDESLSYAEKSCPCAVASHIRPSQKVYPDSAYFGTTAFNRALTAKPEEEILNAFLVIPWS